MQVKRHRLWREPIVPAGWQLNHHWADGEGRDGVGMWYLDADGYIALGVQIYYRPELWGTWEPVAVKQGSGFKLIGETRVIDGHPAYVQYSPLSGSTWSTYVVIYNRATGIVYEVEGFHSSIRGNKIDAAIAIARSLYRSGR